MANISVSLEVQASVEEVWKLIGGFNSLPEWLPYIPYSKLTEGGRVRTLGNRQGDTIVERLEEFNEKERFYSYSILEAPFPIKHYFSTLKVDSGTTESAALVKWSGSFTPIGIEENEAIDIFKSIYSEGLAALKNYIIKI